MSASAKPSAMTTANPPNSKQAAQPHIDPTGFVRLGDKLPMLANILSQSVQAMGLTLSSEQQRMLLLYLDQLLLWNKAYNLTAITDPVDALVKHIIDCLSIIPHLPAGSLLDIGTGAGLPSVIIAICQPERACSALDSNQKKIRFIKQIGSQLGLTNLTPIASRIEAHDGEYEVVTSRAFASLSDFVTAAAPRLAAGGQLCAMKGKAPQADDSDDDMQALAEMWEMNIIKLTVPRLHDSRHLIELSRKSV